MWIFGQSIEKKREKIIRQEAKDFTKQLVEKGMNRQTAKNGMAMLLSLVIEGYQQNKVYAKSKTQIAFAMMLIEKLMEEMQKKDTEDVRERLKKLTSVLEEVFHECTVRRDDADFTDTCTYLKRMADMYDNSQCLMLQSELENLRYLLGEIKEWEEPDFCALAFFLKYGDKNELGELANCLRNEMLIRFYCEKYWDAFERELAAIGMEKAVKVWVKEKVNRFSN